MTRQYTKYSEISKCRVCNNNELVSVVDLGNQFLTGVFPKSGNEPLAYAPLELVKCHSDQNGLNCGLVQLKHSCDPSTLYGDNYGYRSGLNKAMIDHLQSKVQDIVQSIAPEKGDIVLDIGSNDSTLLQAYPANTGLTLTGIDPAGSKFKDYYPQHITLIPGFFSAQLFKSHFGAKKAKIITSIAMFYDLEAPITFMQDIYDTLADDGIWVFEQSYIGSMLENTSYDTICHEHLEYYSLSQIKWMTDKIGFKIINLEFNKINGGSFSVTVAKKNSSWGNLSLITKTLNHELEMRFDRIEPYIRFNKRIEARKEQLMSSIQEINQRQQKVIGYAASTKGNVILQYCGLTADDIPYIAEVNRDKVGHYTPGSNIPIISEKEAMAINPEFFLVLPWHFRQFFIKKEQSYLQSGGKFIFPLPTVEIVEK